MTRRDAADLLALPPVLFGVLCVLVALQWAAAVYELDQRLRKRFP